MSGAEVGVGSRRSVKISSVLRRSLSIAVVVASIGSMAAPSFAQPAAPTAAAKTEAATRFKKGLDLFKDGDYQAALIEFRRACIL